MSQERKAWALSFEPFHENSSIVAFYGTLDEAKAQALEVFDPNVTSSDSIDVTDDHGDCVATWSCYGVLDGFSHLFDKPDWR